MPLLDGVPPRSSSFGSITFASFITLIESWKLACRAQVEPVIRGRRGELPCPLQLSRGKSRHIRHIRKHQLLLLSLLLPFPPSRRTSSESPHLKSRESLYFAPLHAIGCGSTTRSNRKGPGLRVLFDLVPLEIQL